MKKNSKGTKPVTKENTKAQEKKKRTSMRDHIKNSKREPNPPMVF